MEQLLLDNLYGFLRTAVLCIDTEDRIRYLNAFAASELELPQERIIGQRFADLFEARESTVSGGRALRFLPSGKCFEFDDAAGRSGEKIPVLSRLVLEECRGWGVMRFAAAPEREQTLQHAFDDFGLMLLEEERTLQISGSKTPRELFGDGISGLKSFREAPGLSPGCPVLRTLRDSGNYQSEELIGGRIYLITTHPVIKEGRLAGILAAYFNLSSLDEIQSRLVQAMRSAEDANKAKSFFLANMSHELRTPLNAVIGYCELLQEGGLAPQQVHESLSGINFAGNALLRLINNILDLSKIEARQMVFVPKPTDIVSMIQELETLFVHSCRKNNIEQQSDIPPGLPALLVDELRLRQILLNLIGNACKFTRDGFIRIIVRYTPDGKGKGTLSIAVADSGCGIAKEKQEAIFKPFTQEDAMTHPHIFKGTGLGLAISREMALCMRGRIELQSEPGSGSIFTLILEDVPAVNATPAAAEAGSAEQLPEEFLAKLEVLLVDDVPINLRILSAMCTSFGVKNRCAASGAEALRMMREAVPDLVMTDMWMPEMSGVELLAEIRRDETFRHLPVVIVTADVEAHDKGMLEKFDAEILKPISKEKLRNLFIELHSRQTEEQ